MHQKSQVLPAVFPGQTYKLSCLTLGESYSKSTDTFLSNHVVEIFLTCLYGE